tara:strand:- start:357 stop:545 length:189 start_codon:yes stop_codon:yes gene_type:complete
LSSQIVVYTLATAFSISPLQVYEMPVSMVNDMLRIHMEIKRLEAEEMEKIDNKYKSATNIRG